MNSVQNQRHSSASSSERGQYLSFKLGADEYAVEILRVQEILGMRPIVPVPQTPPHVRGVMNLRGAVMPVVDMHAALGFPVEEPGKFSVILVLAVQGRTIGFIVDSVSDVLVFDDAAIDRTQDFGSPIASTYVAGIARNGERLVILLDVDRIVVAAGRSIGTAIAAPSPVEGPSSAARELEALCAPSAWETSEAETVEPLVAHEDPASVTLT